MDIGRRPKGTSRVSPVVLAMTAFIAILLQATLPTALPLAQLFELPLLVVIYFSMVKRNQIFGIWFGAGMGLLQDALSHGYIGQMGMAKAIVGYLAATAALKLEHDNVVVRAVLIGTLVCVQEGFLYFLTHAMLGLPYTFAPTHVAATILVNMALGLILFLAFDRFMQPA